MRACNGCAIHATHLDVEVLDEAAPERVPHDPLPAPHRQQQDHADDGRVDDLSSPRLAFPGWVMDGMKVVVGYKKG